MKKKERTRRKWLAAALLGILAMPFTVHASYNPATGRWLSADPIQEKGGLNRYGFVYNRTAQAIDSLGLYLCDQSCVSQCAAPGDTTACIRMCERYQVESCGGYAKCGTVITRTFSPHGGVFGTVWDAFTRCCIPHEFIISGDGSGRRFNYGGNNEGEGHRSASSTDIWIPKSKSCKDFTDCLEREFGKFNSEATANPLKHCQNAVREALKRCGGTTFGLRPTNPPIPPFPN